MRSPYGITSLCAGAALSLAALLLVLAAPRAQAQQSIAIWNGSPYQTVERNFDPAGFDLTYAGTRNAVALSLDLPDQNVLPLITVYSGEDNASDWLRPSTVQPSRGNIVAPLRDFVPFKGRGADFTRVTRITVSAQPIEGTAPVPVEMTLKAATTLALEMTYTHVDTEGDNTINPGDTLEFTVLVENGAADDALNTDLFLSQADFLAGGLVLVPGSVTADNGAVTTGNTSGDADLLVEIGYIGVRPCALDSATITFQAQIKVPFDRSGGRVCLQARATSDNAPLALSDDPTTPFAGDETCADVVVPGAEAPCQNVLLEENFLLGIPPGWTLDNVDAATPNGTVAFVNDAWVVAAENTNPANGVAVSTSFYTPAAQSDDWIISPPVYLPRESRLRWYARAADPGFRDGYEVRISTTGFAPADFLANPPLFSVAEEAADWQHHVVDLAAAGYAYQYVYIAWRNVSDDKYLLYLDGVELCDTTPSDTPACPGTSLYAQQSKPITGNEFAFFYSDATTARLESFNGISEPIGQITWWGTEFESGTGAPCLTPNRQFHVELLADEALADDGSTLGASAFSYTGVVTVTPTGRGVRNGLSDYFYPEYEYTLTLDTPVTLAQGWLLVQSDATGNCYFAWVRSPDGDGTALSGPPELTPGSLVVDNLNGAFCLSPSSNTGVHTLDRNGDFKVSLSELLRVIQFYNIGGLSCAANPGDTEDGFLPGNAGTFSCTPHDTDYLPQNWIISLSELLRNIQFYNIGGYHYCPLDGTEDGYCPGL